MNICEFKSLSSKDQEAFYKKLVKKKRDDHFALMQLRCTSDVKINKALWEDFKERLITMYSQAKESIDAGEVGGTRVSEDEVLYIDGFKGEDVDQHVNRILTFLMFKADCAVLQEKTMWEVDVPYLQKSEAELKELTESAAKELEGVMPPVPKYVVRKSPAKMFKKNGELSETGPAGSMFYDIKTANLYDYDDYMSSHPEFLRQKVDF